MALAVVLIAGMLVLFLPRGKATAAFLFAALMIPTDQIIVIASVHFPMLRILLLFGFARIAMAKLSGKEEVFSGGFNGLDLAVSLFLVFTAIDGVLLWRQTAEAIYQIGMLYSGLGSYLVLRFLIRDEEDVKRAIRALAWMAIIIAVSMTYEVRTGRNLIYAALGGARSFMEASGTRNDRIRAAGPFAHAILAGTFGGFMLPLFAGLWAKEKTRRKYLALACVAAVVMGVAANSSTALIGTMAGIFALCFWPFRRKMRLVRWGLVVALCLLQLRMRSPIWHVISDIDVVGDSSSYHRYMLVDQCIRHFSDWALVGTKEFASWGWDMWDLSDQYVASAETGGLVPLLSLLGTLIMGFKFLGRMRRSVQGEAGQEFFIWAVGASLFANLVAFFGVSYWDQTMTAWLALLAIVSAVTLPMRRPSPDYSMAREPEPVLAMYPKPALIQAQRSVLK